MPWTWDLSGAPPSPAFVFVDATAEVDQLYEYEIRAVDDERNAVAGNDDTSLGFHAWGEALIGHGQIVSSFCPCPQPCQQPVDLVPCPTECFPDLDQPWPPAVMQAYVDTGQSVLLYGEVHTGQRCGSDIAENAGVTRVEASTCIVAVQPTTWSASKRLYR